jgi:hypothetical protein
MAAAAPHGDRLTTPACDRRLPLVQLQVTSVADLPLCISGDRSSHKACGHF